MSDIRKNEDTNRYEMLIDGEVIGYIEYEQKADNVLDLTHTIVDPEHGGQGYAGELTKFALDDAREQGARVIPTCSYIASYIDKHEEYRDLVA